MVQVLSRCTAVLAQPSVTREDSPPGQRGVGAIGDAHEAPEPNNGWRFHHDLLGVKDHPVGRDYLRLLLQDKNDGAARWHHRKGDVGCVEHQGPSHERECKQAPGGKRRSHVARTNHIGVILVIGGPARVPRSKRTGAARGVLRAGPPTSQGTAFPSHRVVALPIVLVP